MKAGRRWWLFNLLTLLVVVLALGPVVVFLWPYLSGMIDWLFGPSEPFFFEDDGDLSY